MCRWESRKKNLLNIIIPNTACYSTASKHHAHKHETGTVRAACNLGRFFLDEAVTSSPAKTCTRDCKAVNKTGHNYTLHS